MHVAEYLLAITFFTWWVLSLLFQFRESIRRHLRVFYRLGLLSGYRYFAPTPRFMDLHVQHRFRGESGQVMHWMSSQPTCARTWLSVVWHPGSHAQVLSNFCTLLLKRARECGSTEASKSLAYRQILALVTLANPAGLPVQFRILSGRDFAPGSAPMLAFQSQWHTCGSHGSGE